MRYYLVIITFACSISAVAATNQPPGAKRAGAKPSTQTSAPVVNKGAPSLESCQEALDKILGRGADAGKCSYSISVRMKNGDQNFVTVDDSPMYGEPDSKEDQEKITLTRKEGGSYIKVALEHDGAGRLKSVKCGSHGGDPNSIDLSASGAKRLDLMYNSGRCEVVDESAGGDKVTSPGNSRKGSLSR